MSGAPLPPLDISIANPTSATGGTAVSGVGDLNFSGSGLTTSKVMLYGVIGLVGFLIYRKFK